MIIITQQAEEMLLAQQEEQGFGEKLSAEARVEVILVVLLLMLVLTLVFLVLFLMVLVILKWYKLNTRKYWHKIWKAAEAEEAIADLVDAMEAFGGEPPEVLEEVFKPEVRVRWLIMV